AKKMYPTEYIQFLIHFHGDYDYFECHEILEEYWKTKPRGNRDYFETKGLKDIVIVSPDHGGVTRARKMADRLKAPIAIIDKRR
ncbi:DUF309 domain-containing protein, partial [Bacillus cereus]